jgi:hypothetical protein
MNQSASICWLALPLLTLALAILIEMVDDVGKAVGHVGAMHGPLLCNHWVGEACFVTQNLDRKVKHFKIKPH